jgi:hypothetical protein
MAFHNDRVHCGLQTRAIDVFIAFQNRINFLEAKKMAFSEHHFGSLVEKIKTREVKNDCLNPDPELQCTMDISFTYN